MISFLSISLKKKKKKKNDLRCFSFCLHLCVVKIGRPGYRVTKQFDPETKQRSLLFQVSISYLLLFADLAKNTHEFFDVFMQ